MTASDHLKQATGSLGGDQIPEDLKTAYENARIIASSSDATKKGFREWADFAKTLIERIAKSEAALAQKIRECEEKDKLNRWQAESLTSFRNKFGAKSNCQALDAIDDLKAQVEQLGRQVAEMSAGKKALWFNEWRPIIDAIGEISVQEAMDAIERDL